MKNAFMIAATGSGCGKTTITCALLKALLNKGIIPKSYKCGPDYIDPMFHKSVLGIESENLDLFFSAKEEINEIFYENMESDLQIVEGVMGLYDGINSSSIEGSSYDLACKLDIPIILVVNAHGMGRSLLAIIRGFQAMDEENRIKGVILNQISPMYFESISKVIEEELKLAVLGYFPKLSGSSIESRYLGLKLPHEIEKLESDIENAARIISDTVDFNRLLELTICEVKALDTNHAVGVTSNHESDSQVRIAIARDEAFCFLYEANLRLLEKLGARFVEFSPLHDDKIPDNIDGLLLFGGYPELHAKSLSENKSMLESIKKAIDSGIPSLAECGGFMYLHDTIEVEKVVYPMVGVIEGSCQKKDKLVRFGYLEIEEKEKRFLDSKNLAIKGHEFHYYDSSNNGADAISSKPGKGRNWEAGHIGDNHWWGFAHLYYPSNQEFAKAFIEKCLKWRKDHE